MSQTTGRALVTGGAGFVGSRLTADLLDDGYEVHVVDDCSTGDPDLVPAGATLHEADVRDSETVDLLRRVDPDVVYHLAALHYVPYCDEHPGETFDVNVMGTRNLLSAATACDGLDTVVNVSSAAVYPALDRPLSERDDPEPMDVYGKTKLAGEDLARQFAREAGVRAASARLFNVYGPNETNPHLLPAIFDQLADGSREVELGNLAPKRDFVHVADVSRALRAIAAADGAPHHEFNVGTGVAYSVREVVECVAEALGEEVDVVQDDERVRESDRPHLQADVTRIRRETGWEPRVEFVDGLRDLVRAGEKRTV